MPSSKSHRYQSRSSNGLIASLIQDVQEKTLRGASKTWTPKNCLILASLIKDPSIVPIRIPIGMTRTESFAASNRQSSFIAVELLEQLIGLVEAAHRIGGAAGVGMVALGLLPVGLSDLG